MLWNEWLGVGLLVCVAVWLVWLIWGPYWLSGKRSREIYITDPMWSGDSKAALFFWKVYRETGRFNLPHCLAVNSYMHIISLRWEGNLHLRDAWNTFECNLYDYFENPFNPSPEELVLWDLEFADNPYEKIMSSFCENWRE